MIYKEKIKIINNEELQEFCTEVGSISVPIVREIALPNYPERELYAEKYIDDKNNILGVSILIKEGGGEKAILVSRNPTIEMILKSNFNPNFWLLPNTLNLHELGWTVSMEGYYYSGIICKEENEEICDKLDLEWKVFKNGIRPDFIGNSSWIEELIEEKESPIIRADLFREWLLKECFIIICIQKGKPIAIASAYIEPIPVVNFLYCMNEYRGKGIGSTILAKLKKELNIKNYGLLSAMSPKDKEPLYHKASFKSQQSWRLWMK